MDLEKIKEQLKVWGIKVEQLTEKELQELYAKMESEKSKLDTETRRKVRVFWCGVSALCLVLGLALGAWLL